MVILLSSDPSLVTQSDFEKELLLLPQWRREKALKYRFFVDRVLCVKAYILLCNGLKQEYGIVDDLEFVYGTNGKPALKNYPDIHFSLSHCKKGVICVLDNHEVGCDIEEIYDDVDSQLCSCCFNERERKQIQSPTDFAKLWTMKEAYLKYTGEGLSNNLPSLFDQSNMEKVSFWTEIYEKERFVVSVCQPKFAVGKEKVSVSPFRY